MKLLALALAAAAFALPTVASAQTVGSYDSGNCYPFMCNDSGTDVGPSINYYQIYDAGQFTGPISIESLTFFTFGSAGTVIGGTYDISLAVTTDAVGTPLSSLSAESGFFLGNLGGPIGGSLTIAGAAYAYDPMDGNLVLHVSVSDQDLVPNGGGNSYFWADYTGIVTSREYELVGQGVVSGTTGGLVTRFNTVPEPATWALLITGFGLVGASLRRRKPAIA